MRARKEAHAPFGHGSVDVPTASHLRGPVLGSRSMGRRFVVINWIGNELSVRLVLLPRAGRVMSRTKAKHSVRGRLRRDPAAAWHRVQADPMPPVRRGAPSIKMWTRWLRGLRAGIAKKVARLRPVVVVKG